MNTIVYENLADSGGNQIWFWDEASDPTITFCDVEGGKEDFGFYIQKGLFEEYRYFGTHGPKKGHDLAEFDAYHKARGLRWPVVNGKETLWRYREGYDPFVEKGKDVQFYGKKDGRAWIFALPYEAPPEMPDKEYDMWL